MKSTKKIIAVILAAMFSLSVLGIAATAATPSVIDPAHAASLTIHKYIMDDVSDATYPGTGLAADAAQIPADAKPLGGIVFNVYPAVTTAVKDAAAVPTNYVEVGTTGYWYDATSTAAYTLTTADVTGIASSAVAQNTYAVVEQFDSRVASPAAPFVVSVPMTNPTNGSEWIYDVNVYPKNSPLSIDKTVNTIKNETASIGDTLNWEITADIPASIATAKTYKVTDTLDSRLTYQSNVVVKAYKDGASPAQETVFTVDTDYTVGFTAETNTVVVDFTAAGFAKLATAYAASQKKVYVSFDTVLNSTATAGSLENNATLIFKDANDNETTPTVATKPTVAFGGFAISKVEKGTTTPLAGAQFQIASSLENAKNGNFIKKAADGSLIDFGETGYDTASDWTETTMSNGLAAFTGLSYDLKNGTNYYVVEVKAPMYDSDVNGSLDKSYNLLSAPVEVLVKSGTNTAQIIDTEAVDAVPAVTHSLTNLSAVVTVENSKGFTLPFTGGEGTIIFTVAGIALIAGAAVLLVISLKKKKTVED